MENISFVLWMALYPLSVSIASYFGSKERKINNKEPYPQSALATAQLINIFIWFLVGLILLNK